MTLSTRMIRQVKNIASPYSDYSMKLTKWTPNSAKKPRIESMAFTINGNTNSTYSKRVSQNGVVFEIFKSNNEVLKILRDRFGKVLGYKSNFKIPLDDVNRVYDNASNMMRSRLSSLYTIPAGIRAHN